MYACTDLKATEHPTYPLMPNRTCLCYTYIHIYIYIYIYNPHMQRQVKGLCAPVQKALERQAVFIMFASGKLLQIWSDVGEIRSVSACKETAEED